MNLNINLEKAQVEKPARSKRSLTANGEKRLIIFLFLFLPVGLLLLFSYYPAVRLIELSFSNWNGYSHKYDYIGLMNFKEVFLDSRVWMAFTNTFAYVVMGVLQVFLGLYIAVVLNTNIRFRNFFRSMLFLPYVLNSIAVSFMFNFLYNVDTNPVNIFLKNIGLGEHAVRLLSESYFSNFSLAFISLWCHTGFCIILFIGALQSIPLEQFEAADIDGANFGQKLCHIVIPSIKSIVGLNLFLNLNSSLQAYYQAFLITKGGPAGATDTFVTLTLSTAFEYSNFGKASAMGVVLFVIIVAVVFLQNKIVGKEKLD